MPFSVWEIDRNKLQRLTGLEVEKLAREYAKLVEEIDGYEAILNDERLVVDIIREDLYELKTKFLRCGRPHRRTRNDSITARRIS